MSETLVFRLFRPGKVGIASLDQVAAEGGVHWIHLDNWTREDAERFLIDRLDVTRSLADKACQPNPSQRPQYRHGGVAFVLPLLEESETSRDEAMLGVVAEGDRVITLSTCPCPAVRELLQLWVEDPEAVGQTSPELLRSLVDEVVDRFYPHIDRIHDRVESLEDQVFESQCLEPAAALCMKRELLEVRRLIAPLRDTTQALLRHGEPWASKEIGQDYQDILSHVLRHIESLDLARDILSTIMDAQLSLASNRLNEVMRVLTVVSTLMMACSLVAGIYGMNFDFMPETKWLYGYPFALGMMGLACAGILFIFRRRKWI